MDQAARGASALAAGDFKSAVSHYTDAICSNPQAVDYYIKRSTACARSSPVDHESALKDAETAVVLATKRAKRELIAQAQLRRGVALFGLERWADAKQCFQWVKKLNEKEKTLAMWDMKIEIKLKGLEAGDDRAKLTAKEMPDVEIPASSPVKDTEQKEEVKPSNGESAGAKATPPAPQPEGVQTPASKIRHEWFQQPDNVIVILFAKGIPKAKASVEIKQRSLDISFPLPTGSDFNLSLEPLFAKIDAAASSCKIMSTKAEFTLKKATPGQKWSSLEGSEAVDAESTKTNTDDDKAGETKHAALTDRPSNTGPAYPTSSKSGPKNWDRLANDLTKKPKKESSAGAEEDDDDGVPDDDEGDPVNGFFKKLYKGADDDTRRAMMKSYQESNGTALSTNWGEVGKGTVETTPPDSMEAKKW